MRRHVSSDNDTAATTVVARDEFAVKNLFSCCRSSVRPIIAFSSHFSFSLCCILNALSVGRVELEFLVNSGFGFGFLLGLGQMAAWAAHPAAWTLPAAGALVGYVTNWIAIHMIFEPAEPVKVLGLIEVQGLFESRQVEVSDEFGDCTF